MISFTPAELRTIHNSDFFRIKSSATFKIDSLLAETRDKIKSLIEKEKLGFPKEVDASMGKIFRGENYLGLPYLVLDFPKYFGKDSVLAFRTMFWWGNFFSCTLHIAPVKSFRPNLLLKKGVYFCVNDNPWQYQYEKDNYILIDKLSEKKILTHIKKNNFIKLSRKIKLKDYKKLPKFAEETFSILSSS